MNGAEAAAADDTNFLQSYRALYEPTVQELNDDDPSLSASSSSPSLQTRDNGYDELQRIVRADRNPNAEKLLKELRDKVFSSFDLVYDMKELAVIYIIKLFFDEPSYKVSFYQEIQTMFGIVSTSAVEKMFQLCTMFFAECSPNAIDYVRRNGERTNGTTVWKCRYDDLTKTTTTTTEAEPKRTNELPDLYHGILLQPPVNFVVAVDRSSQPSTSGVKPKRNKEWLNKQFERHERELTGLNETDFCDSIVKMMESKKSLDELQNDLVDMLGFDCFELIETLLCNRRQILSDLKEQSETDRSTKQQANKKPIDVKRSTKTKDDGDRVLDISTDASTSKQQRAAYRPRATVKLPFVFNEETLDAGTRAICGGKIVTVPFNAKRKTTEKYEEITIPASKRADVLDGDERLLISALDNVGQILFNGVKSLNHIQTIVFNTAYQTNENMLVCAPTGAGKTNIALLAIGHLIRQNVTNKVLNRNRFKIVYICPMKALAAEMTTNFSKKLSPLGLAVKEVTGDMQLSRREIIETQMLVTTPEKWDVITRKGTGETELINLVKLIILDEVHLLNTDRGPVIEALVARTLRQVMSSQKMIRLVGLSATLPNYLDVAQFLRVNPQVGLFFFDSRFRSVPLEQVFVGVKATKVLEQIVDMDKICYDKVVELLRAGHQAMVFVHARNMTVRTGVNLKGAAIKAGTADLFLDPDKAKQQLFRREVEHVHNKMHAELLQFGIGVHHAGMMRNDRNFVEKFFLQGSVRVIVCTATLAWGVNLPAHGVIIKGTQIYNSQKCAYVDLDVLDVLQIFGRAGRPQFDKSGTGIIITSNDKMHHYLSLLTNQCPIESKFLECLADNLNAEIVLGTVSNLADAIEWLTYTYLYRRIRLNPLVYGIAPSELADDPTLKEKCLHFIRLAARQLDKAHMIRFNEKNGDLVSTYIGRIASFYYIKYNTIEVINQHMTSFMTAADIIAMMAEAQEFQQIQVRKEELDELDELSDNYCELRVTGGGSENANGKVNILMQSYLSRARMDTVSLISDMEYVAQNVVRIVRSIFEMALHKNLPTLADRCLTVTKMFEARMWDFQTPLRQFSAEIPMLVLEKIEEKKFTVDDLREYDPKNLGQVLRDHRSGGKVVRCAHHLPTVEVVSSYIYPITRGVLRVSLRLKPNFVWNDRYHDRPNESFWLWVEDPDNDLILHSELCTFSKTVVVRKEPVEMVFTVALCDDYPPQYIIHVVSDRWFGSTLIYPLSFRNLTLPSSHTPYTDLLELRPLPTSVLRNVEYESLYNFSHFNPIQTQIFHSLYHTDCNVLLGAPTGSGKTIAAELCMFRLFNVEPKRKVVYIAPLKALVRERVHDWRERFEKRLQLSVVEVTGDVTPRFDKLRTASIIITTPEKWDGISRSWQSRDYVKHVGLIIIDEIHLLGEDRGAVLEVIVTRTNFIASNTNRRPRIIGLSTAMANAGDLGNWLGVEPMGMFNFRPTVRPVPLEVHISGFPAKSYCPRMVSMNRPAYQAIRQHAPHSPTLIFVSSRRQTRLTALDLLAYLAIDEEPKQWLHEDPYVMENILSTVLDNTLKDSLTFGIGIHHGGLQENDRKVVEKLFLTQKIQILIATATLAWGVNFPAHLVVIKGTEYFDARVKRYVDMPLTDVLQMMGRAGRPQFDNSGVACVFVHDVKKNFYKKFLYEPFPVESNLLPALPDHINAEIVAGTLNSKKKIIDYITWTYFFRRLLENPSFYKLSNIEPEHVNNYLQYLTESILEKLTESGCVRIDEDEEVFEATHLGQVASLYYLSHKTVHHFDRRITRHLSLIELLQVMCDAEEYSTFSVRHNEDRINSELSKNVRFPVTSAEYESPHVKANLLLQAHFSNLEMPNPDYKVDLRSVMDQALRILQAMIDVAANKGWLSSTLRILYIVQMIIQGEWFDVEPLCQISTVESHSCYKLNDAIDRNENLSKCKASTLPGMQVAVGSYRSDVTQVLTEVYGAKRAEQTIKQVANLPWIKMDFNLLGNGDDAIPLTKDGSEVYSVTQGQDYLVAVDVVRYGADKQTVYCPKFSKSKEESWFLILGDEDDELLALKRISIKSKRDCKYRISFRAPDRTGNYIVSLYLVSDSYIGIDQQYNFPIKVMANGAASSLSNDYN